MADKEFKPLFEAEDVKRFAHLADMHEKGQAYLKSILDDKEADPDLSVAVYRRQELLKVQMHEMLFPNKQRTN